MEAASKKIDRVLIIDDSLTVRAKLKDLMVENGYDVSMASCGTEGLEVLAKEDFDVVVLDLLMPDMSGSEVLWQIRSEKRLEGLPVALLSAVSEVDDIVTNIELGADDYLVKPWRDRELLARIHGLVRLKRANDAVRSGEAMARVLLNAPSQIAVLIDCDGLVLSGNDGLREIVSEEFLSGKRIIFKGKKFIDILPPSTQAYWKEKTECATEKGQPEMFETEWNERAYSAGVYPIDEGHGVISGCSIIMHDITERKRAEEERERLGAMLIDASRQAGMAEVAIGVLHNVGNILNSVNVSVGQMEQKLKGNLIATLKKAVGLMEGHTDDLSTFMLQDPKGSKLPNFFHKISTQLLSERDDLCKEISTLSKHVNHVMDVVASQQDLCKQSSVIQELKLADVFREVLTLHGADGVEVICPEVQCDKDLPLVCSDKHRLVQIILCLIGNAQDAVADQDPGKITISARVEADDFVVEVTDNGIGIPEENLAQIFFHGFTTKTEGSGFGLHSSANMATELKGTLTVTSPGEGNGATFILKLPNERTELAVSGKDPNPKSASPVVDMANMSTGNTPAESS